jgi:hypothetical protein
VDPSAPSVFYRPTDLRLIPEDKKLLLIEDSAVQFYDYDNPQLQLNFLFRVPLPSGWNVACPGPSSYPRIVSTLRGGVVQADAGLRRLFLVALIQHFRDPVVAKSRGIVVLNIDPGYVASQTSFDLAHVFDPYDCALDPLVDPPFDHATWDLALVKDTLGWFLVAVGKREHGVKVFLLNNFPTVGFDRAPAGALLAQRYVLPGDQRLPGRQPRQRKYAEPTAHRLEVARDLRAGAAVLVRRCG